MFPFPAYLPRALTDSIVARLYKRPIRHSGSRQMTRTRIVIPLLLLAILAGTVYADGKRVSDLDLAVVDSDIQPGVIIEEHPNRATSIASTGLFSFTAMNPSV